MANPVSFAVSLITLDHAVQVGGEGLVTLKFCYSAPSEIARLRAEVDSLGQLLGDVQDFVDGNSALKSRHAADIFTAPVELATARIGSINKILASPAFGLEADRRKPRHGQPYCGIQSDLQLLNERSKSLFKRLCALMFGNRVSCSPRST